MLANLNANSTMALSDQRAPGVSSGLRTRIATLPDSGANVSLRRSSLVLRDVVLSRANGTETPAATEMRLQVARRGLDPAPFSLERWDREAAVEHAGDRTFAFDRDGQRHTITRRRNGQRVVTNAGRRFYQEAPLTQWIVNVPVVSIRARSGARFNVRYIAVTDEMLQALEDNATNPAPNLRLTKDRGDTKHQV